MRKLALLAFLACRPTFIVPANLDVTALSDAAVDELEDRGETCAGNGVCLERYTLSERTMSELKALCRRGCPMQELLPGEVFVYNSPVYIE